MPIVLGWNALFGRTDKVPGLFFVGTSFFYFCFIPLIPLGSYIVRYEDDDWFGGFKGVPIGFNVKSVLYGWLRTAAVLTIIIVTSQFIVGWWNGPREHLEYVDGQPIKWEALDLPGWNGIMMIAAALIALWVLRATSVASGERALELAQRAGYQIEKVQPA
jgi:hypothetical protein